MIVAIIVSLLVAGAYWTLALVLGLGGRRRARYVLDAVVAVVAATNYAVVPPMVQVVDDGRGAEVTNTTEVWLTVALARVLQDNQGEWRACPLLTVGEISDFYRYSIGPGQTTRYAPLPDCAGGFHGALLEYRVGDPVRDAVGWWSDTAFAVPNGRLP